MSLLLEYILYFFIYAFMGWICESIYCSLANKKIINRGFLNGPICTIYGFGGLIDILLLSKFSLIYIFIFGLILTSLLEYITSILLERIFHTCLWNYSKNKLNINSRVCLKNSLMFGIMSVIIVKIVHPYLSNLINKINITYISIIVICLLIITSIDFISTANAINYLKFRLNKYEEFISEFISLNKNLHIFSEEELHKKVKYSPILNRLFRAFPNMKSIESEKRNHYLQHFKNLINKK